MSRDLASISGAEIVQFDRFRFDFSTEVLFDNEAPLELSPKPAKMLGLLLRCAGELVTRDQIASHVWPGRVVDFDQNINFCIRQIREQLGDDPKRPAFLETIPRRGYRFLVVPEVVQHKETSLTKDSNSKVLGYVALLLVVVAAITLFTVSVGVPKGADGTETSDHVVKTPQEVKRALFLMDQGGESNRQRALTILENFVKDNPAKSEGHAGLVLVRLYHAQDEAEREIVREHLRQAQQFAPNHALTQLASAKVALYYNWDVVAAASLFKAAALQAPESILILHDLAVVAVIQQDFVLAEKTIDKILEVAPGQFQQRYHAGWFYQVSGKHDLALKQCVESLELAPSHTFSLLCAGQSSLVMNLNQSAAHYFGLLLEQLGASETEIGAVSAAIQVGKSKPFNDWYISWLGEHSADPFSLALAYGQANEQKQALSSLAEAVKQRHMMVPMALAFTELSDLHNDERFQELMTPVRR